MLQQKVNDPIYYNRQNGDNLAVIAVGSHKY